MNKIWALFSHLAKRINSAKQIFFKSKFWIIWVKISAFKMTLRNDHPAFAVLLHQIMIVSLT